MHSMKVARKKTAEGGSVPEGWEYFSDFKAPVWLGVESQEGLRVSGIMPMKCPLAPVFGTQLERMRLRLAEREPASPGEELTGEALRDAERDRLTEPRHVRRLPVEDLQAFVTNNIAGKHPAFQIKTLMNLCATDRYYDADCLAEQEIEALRFFFPGGGVVLDDRRLTQLLDLLLEVFMKKNQLYAGRTAADLPSIVADATKNGDVSLPVLGVHCTHGVNRTGYVLMNALCMLQAVTLDTLKNVFERSRGHQVNKDLFVRHVDEVWIKPETADRYRNIRAKRLPCAAFCL